LIVLAPAVPVATVTEQSIDFLACRERWHQASWSAAVVAQTSDVDREPHLASKLQQPVVRFGSPSGDFGHVRCPRALLHSSTMPSPIFLSFSSTRGSWPGRIRSGEEARSWRRWNAWY